MVAMRTAFAHFSDAAGPRCSGLNQVFLVRMATPAVRDERLLAASALKSLLVSLDTTTTDAGAIAVAGSQRCRSS